MQVLNTIAEVREALADARGRRGDGDGDGHGEGRGYGVTVGFVPTMGFLHDGHAALIERAVGECDITVVSIFVNPLQFAPTEDLASYPRDIERDLDRCYKAGVGVVFEPDVDEMYPEPPLIRVLPTGRLASVLEGERRPEHFAGVATVVAKLFSIVGPCRAYFGEKDYQQLLVVSRLAADLSFPVEVVGCPTVRAPDGLALSSRNAYLTPEERSAAPQLYQALQAAAAAIEAGERRPDAIRAFLAEQLRAEPRFAVDYAEVVDAATLEPVEILGGDLRLLAAIRLGRARLIDNLGVTVETAPTE